LRTAGKRDFCYPGSDSCRTGRPEHSNRNGDRPLIDNDPTKPNEDYFMFVDSLIRLAASKGIFIGLLPTWGDKVDKAGWVKDR